MLVFFFEGNSFFEAVVGLWKHVIIRNDSGKAVFIGNHLSFVSSRFNMCNKLISISFAINIEPVRPSTRTHFFILAHCVFEFDTPALGGAAVLYTVKESTGRTEYYTKY